jgi:hypothetical protein
MQATKEDLENQGGHFNIPILTANAKKATIIHSGCQEYLVIKGGMRSCDSSMNRMELTK